MRKHITILSIILLAACLLSPNPSGDLFGTFKKIGWERTGIYFGIPLPWYAYYSTDVTADVTGNGVTASMITNESVIWINAIIDVFIFLTTIVTVCLICRAFVHRRPCGPKT